MAGVKLEGVSKIYPGGVKAVDGLDLEVQDREFLVLLGPSGCGKSSTLRMIAGLEQASEGRIRIGDRAVDRVPPKDRDIAMVFQNYALYPHMTVYKNMAFGLQLRYGGGLLSRIWNRLVRPREAARLAELRRGIGERVREAARILGIGELLERMPRELSGGERQRVALGRAIVRKPAAFLFDEPLSNLDARLRVEMRRELKRLHQTLQATIVYVTHDQVEALTLGQRIVVMRRGEVQQIGTPLEVYDRPRNRFVAGFIGAPPMNFVRGKLVEENESGIRFVSDRLTIRLLASQVDSLRSCTGRQVWLGIRPEAISASGSQTGCGRVKIVEPLGDATLLHVELGRQDSPVETRSSRGDEQGRGDEDTGDSLICKTEPNTTLQVGNEVELELDTSRVHIFDAESEKNLTW